VKTKYIGKGIYEVNQYTVVPRALYCSCKSTKIECKHLKEVFARLQDDSVGVY